MYGGVNFVYLYFKDFYCIISIIFCKCVIFVFLGIFYTIVLWCKLGFIFCFVDEINVEEVKWCSESGFVSMENSLFYERKGYWKEDVIVF